MRALCAAAANATPSAPKLCTASNAGAGLEQDAHQIDDDIAAAHRSRDRRPIAHVGLDRVNLADAAERLQMTGEVRAAHRDADAILPLCQRLHHVPAEKPRAAENGDQGFRIGFRVMAALPRRR